MTASDLAHAALRVVRGGRLLAEALDPGRTITGGRVARGTALVRGGERYFRNPS